MKKFWLFIVPVVGMIACTEKNVPEDTTEKEGSAVAETDTVGDNVDDQVWTDTLKIVWSGAAATVKGSVDSVTVSSTNGYVVVNSTSSHLITYILSGSGTGNISIYGETKFNLTLDGLTLSCSNAPAINNQCKKSCFIVVNGTNSISDGSSYASSDEDRKAALFSEGQLIFSGDGSLAVTGKYKHGVASDDYIHLRSGNLTISSSSDGLRANDGVFIDGGSLTITAGADGIQCDTNVVTIKGGTTVVKASDEGITSYGAITITGGNTYVQAADDGINSKSDITVSGGYVCAYSTGNDGIDANGNCYIKGGLVYAIGAREPEVAIDANSEEGKKLYLTGGTIVAIGGLESGASLSQSCYQASWSTNTWYALTVGSDVFAFKTPSSGGNTMVVSGASTPTLTQGVTASGTSIFNSTAYYPASVSGGSNVSLSAYSGSSSGGGPGSGGPGGPGGGGPGR